MTQQNVQLSTNLSQRITQISQKRAILLCFRNRKRLFLNWNGYNKLFKNAMVPSSWLLRITNFSWLIVREKFLVRVTINSKFLYFCRGYPMKCCCFLVASIVCKITLCLLDIVIHIRCYVPHLTSTLKRYFS